MSMAEEAQNAAAAAAAAVAVHMLVVAAVAVDGVDKVVVETIAVAVVVGVAAVVGGGVDTAVEDMLVAVVGMARPVWSVLGTGAGIGVGIVMVVAWKKDRRALRLVEGIAVGGVLLVVGRGQRAAMGTRHVFFPCPCPGGSRRPPRRFCRRLCSQCDQRVQNRAGSCTARAAQQQTAASRPQPAACFPCCP